MSEEKGKSENSYRNILRGTSLFGGVQVFQILINLVRGKFVSLFLGPAGMGLNALFSSTSLLMVQASSLGLNLGIVKEVAARRDDPKALHHAIRVAIRLFTATSLLGALICILFSGVLSRFTFGSTDYSTQIMWLSVAVALTIASNGLMSIVQGLHEVKILSKASLVGAITGLIAGVPLYYFYGTSGIVPAIIVLAFSSFAFYALSLRKTVRLSDEDEFVWENAKSLSKKMIMLGLVLMSGDLIGSAGNYITNIFIRHFGALDDVGLFQGANSLTNQYAGVVFTAMMLDFLPRLSKAADNNDEMNMVVNRQLEIVALIATPLLCLLILFSPIVIRVLLTDKFLSIIPLMRWMGLGVLLRAFAFPLGYITFAKDNPRLFFWIEGVGTNVLAVTLNCSLYYFFGLIGLGISIAVDAIISFFTYHAINRRLYNCRINAVGIKALGIGAFTGLCVFLASLIPSAIPAYLLMATISLGALIFSASHLRRLLKSGL